MAPTAALAKLEIKGNAIHAETKTLKAVLKKGALVSLIRKSDNQEFIDASQADSLAVKLIFPNQEAVPLGGESQDAFIPVLINPYRADLRIQGWHGDAVLAIGVDTATGDLLIEPGGYSSRPGLRAVRWMLSGIKPGLELLAPIFQGVQAGLENPLFHNQRFDWPYYWEAGFALLAGQAGGCWVRCEDTQYRYKALQVGTAPRPGSGTGPRCLGFDTEAYGPLENSLAAGGLAWRINVYDGDWPVPAGQYRDWLARAYSLQTEAPAWVKDLKLAVSWCPTDMKILKALAKKVKPGRVLLHVPHWRSDPYDQNYPTYKASAEGKAFIQEAQKMGFRVMPHCNSIDMDPTHPAYNYIRDFQYREIETKHVAGWCWADHNIKQVPESNSGRLRHRSNNTMVKVHPGLSLWRSVLTENVRAAKEDLGLDIVFLDVTLHSRNLHNCLVENTTSSEGMKRLINEVRSLGRGLVAGGEGRNEITMQEQALSQVHLFMSWAQNVEGLETLKAVPLNEFLFGRWSRSFGYTDLNGKTPAQELRMKMHAAHGALATLTVEKAEEIEKPNPTVQKILAEAGK